MFLVRKIEFTEDFLFFNSGRGTLKWLLSLEKSFSGKKLNIGIPCYACYTVYQSVIESHSEPILLDINPFCFSFPDQLTEQINKLDVLIWINYFGFKYNNILEKIRKIFPKLIIIEDCSHVDLRDYLKIYKEECYSDYSIFSFNFRKPITAGGGGLLILRDCRSTSLNHFLISNYKLLKTERLTFKKIIHILLYNFSYNYLIFLIFSKLISKIREKPFEIETSPLKCSLINHYMMKLLSAQYIRKSEKSDLEKYTLKYFNLQSELVDKYCFGSLYYYPVVLDPRCMGTISSNVDKFMLWENLVESYKAFNVEVSQKKFPLTFNFLYKSIFLPAKYFKNPYRFKFVFTDCIT